MPFNFDDHAQPATMGEAVTLIYDSLDDDEIEFIKENSSSLLHFSFGMAMRNGWNLWGTQEEKPTTLKDHMREVYDIHHADDISGMILESLAKVVKGETPDSNADAQGYKDYWASQGIDPAKQA